MNLCVKSDEAQQGQTPRNHRPRPLRGRGRWILTVVAELKNYK